MQDNVGAVSSDQAADAADAMQAAAFRVVFARERGDLVVQLANLVRQSTKDMTLGSQQRVAELRHAIRHAENEIRKIDRMLEALEQRFPAELRRPA